MNIKSPCIMCVQYIGGYSVHWGCSLHRGVFSTLGEYHEYIGGVKYIGGYSTMSALGRWDTMNTLGDIMMDVGGYHEYIGGCSVHQGISCVHFGIS